jgi:hypothetical protein
MDINFLTPFEQGLLAHLIADWPLQNDWMANNKSSLRHPAAWAHGAVQFIFLSLALGLQAGIILATLHILIDTRVPLRWWQSLIGQTTDGPTALHTQIWTDQVIHIAAIAVWVVYSGA